MQPAVTRNARERAKQGSQCALLSDCPRWPVAASCLPRSPPFIDLLGTDTKPGALPRLVARKMTKGPVYLNDDATDLVVDSRCSGSKNEPYVDQNLTYPQVWVA